MDLQIGESPCLISKNLLEENLVCREDQLTLYEMSPAQPILPVIVETAALITTPVGATIIKVQTPLENQQEITCIPTGQPGQFIQSQLNVSTTNSTSTTITNTNTSSTNSQQQQQQQGQQQQRQQQQQQQTAIHLQHSTPHLVTIQVPESSLHNSQNQTVQFGLLQRQQQQQHQQQQQQAGNSVIENIQSKSNNQDENIDCETEEMNSNSLEIQTVEQSQITENVESDKSVPNSSSLIESQNGQNCSNDLLSCLICGKHFVSIGRLKSHEKTHTKSRPFKCIDCGKTFTVRYSLICHTRVHTRERPYSCNLCGSRFSQASSLKTHQIYKHTKDFPYMCRHCGRGFISPGQKHEHILRSHSKQTKSKRGKNSRRKTKDIPNDTGDNVKCSSKEGNNNFEPRMATTSVQTHLSLPPNTLYQ